jgi:small-conductance mechanosensitive channel
MNDAEPVTAAQPDAIHVPNLELTPFIPDSLQPYWDSFSDYPGLLTVMLIAVAYIFGWVLRWAISRSLMKIAARTLTKADDHLVEYLTKPLVLTTVTLALMLAVSAYPLPQGLHSATLSLLATILLFSWLRANMRAARIVLELIASNSGRFEVVEERTIPVFSMTIKILLIGLAAYIFMLIWGINPTAWLASAGVIGIAVGFAAKDTLANLFSGISIVADAPYKIGDYVVIDTGERGKVTHVGMRSTRILTRDDVEVTIPNAVIANAKIVNESGGPWVKHRIRVPVGVAYGSDVEAVCNLLEETARAHPSVVKQPAPRVRMRAFGTSSLDFELLAWIDHPQLRGLIRHELLIVIYKALNENEIVIPFPQTDVHLRSTPED